MAMPSTSKKPSKKRKGRLWRISTHVLLILAGLYLAVGFLLVPPLLERIAASQTGQHLDADLTMETVSFNPITLRLTLREVSLAESNGEPVFELAEGDFRLSWSSLVRLAPVFQSISLTEPALWVTRAADGEWNLERLLPDSVGDAGKPEKTSADSPSLPRLAIRHFLLSGGSLHLEDRWPDQPVSVIIAPFAFDLDGFSTFSSEGNEWNFEARESGGGSLHYRGSFSLDPLSAEGVLTIRDLVLDHGSPYLLALLGVELSGGRLGLEVEHRLEMADPATPLFTATLRHLDLADGAFTEPGADRPFFQSGLLRIGETRFQFPEPRVEVSSILWDDGVLRAVRLEDGTLDLARLIPPREKAPEEETPETREGLPMAFDIGSLEIRRFSTEVMDRSLASPAVLRGGLASLRLRDLSHDLSKPVPVEADFTLEDDHVLRAAGHIVPQPLAAEISMELEIPGLQLFNPWIAQALPFSLPGGSLATSGTVTMEMDGQDAPRIYFQGDTRLRGISVADSDGTVLLSMNELSLEEAEFRTDPPGFGAGLLRIVDPAINLVFDAEGQINLTRDIPRAKEESGQKETEGVLPWTASLTRLEIEGGSVNITDQSVSPEFRLRLAPLELDLRNLSTDPATRAGVNLRARVDRSADLRIEGETSPLAADTFTDLKITLEGYPLPSLSPYTGRHIGRTLAQGRLSLNVETKIEERRLDAFTSTVFDQLRLGERVESPDAVNLPLDLALSVLRDRRGRIALDLPITGDIGDPRFSVAGVITQTLSNVLTRIATAPFSMLGNLFGGRGEELATLAFAGGSADLSTDVRSKLEELAKILHERPTLTLVIEGRFHPGSDLPALARQRLGEAILAHWADLDPPGPADWEEALGEPFLEAYHRHRHPPPPVSSTDGETGSDRAPATTGPEEALPPAEAEAEAEEREGAETVSPESDGETTFLRTLRRWLFAPSVVEREHPAEPKAQPMPMEEIPEPPSPMTDPSLSEREPHDPEVPQFEGPDPAEMKARLLEEINAGLEELSDLAQRRSAKTRDYLLSTEKVEGERLVITDTREGERPEVHFDLR